MASSPRSNKRKHQVAELEQELLDCAENGDFDRTQELVEMQRVNVNCTNAEGETALIRAAERLDPSREAERMARLLLEHSANVDVVDNYRFTALGNAVRQGRVALAQLLLEHSADVEMKCGIYSPLVYAILDFSVEMVGLLLRFGANTAETLYNGRTYSAVYVACMYPCMMGFNDEVQTEAVVRLLLEHEDGASVNAYFRDECCGFMSPLCWACRNDHLGVARVLIQHGARVIFDGASPCPLKHAIELGSFELVQFLLDNSRYSVQSANVENARPPEVGTPHPLSPPLETSIHFFHQEAAQFLVDLGANVNDPAFCFLYKAAQDDNYDAACLLLRAGANVNLVDRSSGETPLWSAARYGQVEFVQEFLKARADVSIRDNKNGETPLGAAYRCGHKGIVYMLLRTSPHVWSKLKEIW